MRSSRSARGHPLPGVELLVVRGDVDVGVAAGEGEREPFLRLAVPASLPVGRRAAPPARRRSASRALSRSSSALVVPTSSQARGRPPRPASRPRRCRPAASARRRAAWRAGRRRRAGRARSASGRHWGDRIRGRVGASWPELRRLGAQARHAGVAAFEMADDRHQRGDRRSGPAACTRRRWRRSPASSGCITPKSWRGRLLGRASRRPSRPGGRGCRRCRPAGQLVVEHVGSCAHSRCRARR